MGHYTLDGLFFKNCFMIKLVCWTTNGDGNDDDDENDQSFESSEKHDFDQDQFGPECSINEDLKVKLGVILKNQMVICLIQKHRIIAKLSFKFAEYLDVALDSRSLQVLKHDSSSNTHRVYFRIDATFGEFC